MTTTTTDKTATIWQLTSQSTTATLTEALASFAKDHPGAIGYVMSPRAAYWIRHTGDGWTRPSQAVRSDEDKEIRALEAGDIEAVFEARLFAGNPGEGAPAELRWVHESAGTCRAVTISAADVPDADGAGGPTTLPGVKPQERLLWGRATGSRKDGWVELADARIGAYSVPFDKEISERDQLVFKVLEFTETDAHGNCFVVDELIRGLERTKAKESVVEAGSGKGNEK